MKRELTAGEMFWYVMGNLWLGAAYFAKVPVKKAMHDAGLSSALTGAEKFWYVCENIFGLGSGYLMKVIVAKALYERYPAVPAPAAAFNSPTSKP